MAKESDISRLISWISCDLIKCVEISCLSRRPALRTPQTGAPPEGDASATCVPLSIPPSLLLCYDEIGRKSSEIGTGFLVPDWEFLFNAKFERRHSKCICGCRQRALE